MSLCKYACNEVSIYVRKYVNKYWKFVSQKVCM